MVYPLDYVLFLLVSDYLEGFASVSAILSQSSLFHLLKMSNMCVLFLLKPVTRTFTKLCDRQNQNSKMFDGSLLWFVNDLCPPGNI